MNRMGYLVWLREPHVILNKESHGTMSGFRQEVQISGMIVCDCEFTHSVIANAITSEADEHAFGIAV
jgi:hypothetical protein